MYKSMKLAVKALGILAGSAVLGFLLLALAFFIPVNPENMQASYDIIEKEGWYPAMPIVSSSLDTYFHSLMPGVLDNSTDRVMLTTALEASDDSPFRAAMDMQGYSYYWHGYVSILRPLLYLFDYGEIRVLNCAGQLLFLFFLTHFLWKKKGLRYALMLFSSYIFLMPIAMPLSLQFSWVFYLAYGGTAFLLVRQEKLQKESGIYLFFLILGILTSFLDLLTYPLYTWAIPLIWLLAMEQEGKSIWQHLRQVIGTGCFWLMGYAGMWASKWLLGSMILKTNIFESAMAEVFLRAGMEEGTKSGNALKRIRRGSYRRSSHKRAASGRKYLQLPPPVPFHPLVFDHQLDGRAGRPSI